MPGLDRSATMPSREPSSLEIHKALADDTRFRLYRYLGLSGRPVPVRELSTRLSLHPNTLRPHLRRLEEAGLVRREAHRAATVGRPQTLYTAVERADRDTRDFRLLAEILAGLATGAKARARAVGLAREWGEYLAVRGGPKPGTRAAGRLGLAVLQEAMASAGFDPRFRRAHDGSVEVTLRDCPFRELLDDHRDLVCAVHRGLVEGMLAALKPPLELTSFSPLTERSTCRLEAAARAS
ncbi:MAG: helix-turn-helix domain-containing protein [Actinobacteria bacterium]|nr:helix-turn-helix domain-containing protein [Actinomycetota bacterium]